MPGRQLAVWRCGSVTVLNSTPTARDPGVSHDCGLWTDRIYASFCRPVFSPRPVSHRKTWDFRGRLFVGRNCFWLGLVVGDVASALKLVGNTMVGGLAGGLVGLNVTDSMCKGSDYVARIPAHGILTTCPKRVPVTTFPCPYRPIHGMFASGTATLLPL